MSTVQTPSVDLERQRQRDGHVDGCKHTQGIGLLHENTQGTGIAQSRPLAEGQTIAFEHVLHQIYEPMMQFVSAEEASSLRRQLRCVSRQCHGDADDRTRHTSRLMAFSIQWGTSMGRVSRRILRAGRAFALWTFLELVAFPALVLLRTARVNIPLWLVFLPTWAALTVGLYTAWTAFRLRRDVSQAIRMQATSRQRPLLQMQRRTLDDSRALNVLHVTVSLPLPVTHLAIMAHWFLDGCILSLVPSLLLSIVFTWFLLRRRCSFRPIACMLSSIALIMEWSFFPACLLPTVGALHLKWYVIFWLTPVTMPYIILFIVAVEAQAYSSAAAIVLIYMAAVCLHEGLIALGVVGAGLSCVCLASAGCLLAGQLWRLSRRGGFVRHEQVEAIFIWIEDLLGEDD